MREVERRERPCAFVVLLFFPFLESTAQSRYFKVSLSDRKRRHTQRDMDTDTDTDTHTHARTHPRIGQAEIRFRGMLMA